MKEFDRYIKSEIESLNEVPGVKFDEKQVWRNVASTRNGNYIFSVIIVFVTLALVTILLLPEDLVESKTLTASASRVSEFESTIGGNNNLLEDETFQEISSGIIEAEIEIDSHLSPSDSLKDQFNSSREQLEESQMDSYESSVVTYFSTNNRQETRTVAQLKNEDVRKEFSFSMGKEIQTVGYTYLYPIGNHFSLNYGVQMTQSWNNIFCTNADLHNRFELYQVQVPIGLRYDLRKKEGWFNPFLYSGIQNSFEINTMSRMLDYNMIFESKLGADLRIFSTNDGKKGYLRFKIPLYNKNIINQGLYQPTLYDALK